MKLAHKDFFKIYYEDTDSSGYTYHTSYLKFAERSRSNLLRKNFPSLINNLRSNSYFFVVKKISANFLKPSYLFDKICVESYYEGNTFTSISLIQRITIN